MVDYNKELVSALNTVLPTHYEMALTQGTETPCISYMEMNNYSVTDVKGDELIPLIRKCETKPIRVFVDYSENEPDDYFGSSFCAASIMYLKSPKAVRSAAFSSASSGTKRYEMYGPLA